MTTRLMLELSDRDRAILTALRGLRLLTGRQLQRLFFAEEGSGSTNARVARKVLQRLHDHHLIVRLERRVGGLRAGSSSFVYAISSLGLRALGEEARHGRHEPSLRFVDHTLAIAETAVRLHEAKRAGVLAALQIVPEPQSWRSLEAGDGAVLKPDLFVLAADDDSETLAFVEVDCASEHAPAILRKAALYERHFQSGREQAEHDVFPLVLWLVPDRARLVQLERIFDGQRRGLTRALHQVALQADVVDALLKTAEQPITKGGE